MIRYLDVVGDCWERIVRDRWLRDIWRGWGAGSLLDRGVLVAHGLLWGHGVSDFLVDLLHAVLDSEHFLHTINGFRVDQHRLGFRHGVWTGFLSACQSILPSWPKCVGTETDKEDDDEEDPGHAVDGVGVSGSMSSDLDVRGLRGEADFAEFSDESKRTGTEDRWTVGEALST